MDETAEKPAVAAHKDNREHTRLPVHWQAAVLQNQKFVYGKLGDISRGGATFLAETGLAVGAKLPFYIRMPTLDQLSHNQLEMNVQVCNTVLAPSLGCYRIGMRFLTFSGNAEKLLMQFLQSHNM